MGDAQTVLETGQPLEILSCSVGRHSDRTLASLSSWSPFWVNDCENLHVVLPFTAETKCQNCHDVPTGAVLGAAYMEVSLASTTGAIHDNTARSIIIFSFFIVVAVISILVIFNRFVTRPVKMLVHATEMIGRGNLHNEVGDGFDNDEFGRLAESFGRMQRSLDEAQKELIQNERLSTVGQMASGIIHDFRSPMSVVSLGLDLLKEDGTLPESRRREIFVRVRIALDQMKRMTQELLDFSRGVIRLELREQDIPDFVEGIRTLISHEVESKGIRFIVDCRYTGKAIMDRDRLYRAIFNLINNAEDAMPGGGTMTFDIVPEGSVLLFRLTDTGSGIPEEIRDEVFEPFVTAGKGKGTGLGLAVTKKIVEEHGGTITFKSERGKGTSFIICIPINGPQRPSQNS